ncbi:MAG: FKBP-type peptidyl-prolyl cis-trans isomerase [Elusimicrobiota bacterium]
MRTWIAALLVTFTAGTGLAEKPKKDKPAPPAAGAKAGPAALVSEEGKVLYALGVAMGSAVGNFELTPAETETVLMGVKDSIAGRKPQVEMPVYGPKIAELERGRVALRLEAVKKKNTPFLEAAAKEAGAVQLDEGVIYTELAAGTGAVVGSTDTFKAHYKGMLADGAVFSSSRDSGQPYEGEMTGGTIPCWRIGLRKMKVGGKARLVCPPETAYGDEGRPPRIPGASVLVFELELLETGPGPAPAPDAKP